MLEKYERLEMDVLMFTEEDVIVTSPGCSGGAGTEIADLDTP